MRKMPLLADVNTDQQNSGLQMKVVYDRATAARLGITPQQIDNTLYEPFGQTQLSTMYTGVHRDALVLEVPPEFWHTHLRPNDVCIRTPQGKVVPLSAVAHSQATTAPLAGNHQGQYPSVTISFNLAPGVALSDASRAITEMEQKMGMPNTIRG